MTSIMVRNVWVKCGRQMSLQGVPRTAQIGDVVVMQPTGGGPAWHGRLDELRPRGLVASAELPADHAWAASDGASFDARVAFRRRFGPGADCHGLGALLLHLLVKLTL